jgi:nitrate/nitrite transporter NarK
MPGKIHTTSKQTPKWLIILCLIFAGEMIFSLPFHVPRFFRPTLLEVFNLNNAQFGDATAIYGIMAMLSYFPGGILADRFSARKLMSLSLIATSLGGIFFAMIPCQLVLSVIFGYWGMTTVFLFWAAMIRATREWGGRLAQGRAFGLLDGGRGLAAAGAASIAVLVLDAFLPEDLSIATLSNRTTAIQSVILFYSGMTFLAAVIVWIFIPDSQSGSNGSGKRSLSGIQYVIRNRAVWLQAIIVVCAYCGYKGLDFYTLYAVDILGWDEVRAAQWMSNATYLRPIAAIGAGFLADRFTSRKIISITFGLVLISYITLGIITPEVKFLNIIYGNLIFTFIAAYALRGVYFALIGETNIPGIYTGTAVGLISVIGFTPDIFFYAVGGRIIDASPGLVGFHNYYLFLGVFAVLGLLATLILTYRRAIPQH